MANLIITVIAIGLVSMLALAGVYYGGSYFTNTGAYANAAGFMTTGSQIAQAWKSFVYDNNRAPVSWAEMVTDGYLTGIPQIPVQPGGGPAIQATIYQQAGGYWLWYLLGRPGKPTTANDPLAAACLKVIKTATGMGVAMPQSFSFTSANLLSTASGNGTFGCAQWNATLSPPNDLTGTQLTDNPNPYAAGYDYIGFYKLQ
jgi:hypothetical protein